MVAPMNMRAGGTLNVCTVAVASTVDPNSALAATGGTVRPIGIVANFNNQNPDPALTDANALIAALVNQNVSIHGEGAVGVDAQCNFAWAPGDLLMSDGTGLLIVATTQLYYVARAQTAGVVGALCPVDVTIGLAK